jgi:phosphoglycolate phosphatase-like HAD superfamily hydrolase
MTNTTKNAKPVSAVLFDFDGTISTLRLGWEAVMEELMTDLRIARSIALDFIDESTGIQTIFQMKWLAEQIGGDPWEHKAEYNRRLMQSVQKRRDKLTSGEAKPDDYMISGSAKMLKALHSHGIKLYVASGTDDADVKKEVALLGLTEYFTEIKGAPEGKEDCSKEAVIRELLSGMDGAKIAVVGDGKVEIAIGHENGARTLGVAMTQHVADKLLKAGADEIVTDFTNINKIMGFFGIGQTN